MEPNIESGMRRLPQWVKGPIDRELDELPGHSARLGFSIPEFVEAYKTAEVITLSPEDWSHLKNTDSNWPEVTVADVEDYRGHERDVSGIEKRMRFGEEVFAPVVLFQEVQRPYLIGGNTRLMLCRALDVPPKVVAVRL
jgi:hypothetical protein